MLKFVISCNFFLANLQKKLYLFRILHQTLRDNGRIFSGTTFTPTLFIRFDDLTSLNPYSAYYNNFNCFFRWQARRENDPSMYTGLIPSRALQEKRIIHERNQRENSDESTYKNVMRASKNFTNNCGTIFFKTFNV